MDDLEFRRRLLSDPNDPSDDITAELNKHPHNQKYADSLRDLDKQLEQAFKVDVPDDLADKIIFHHAPIKDEVHLSRKTWALAASIIFTLGLLIGQINWGNIIVQPAYANLETQAINHILNEEPFITGVNEDNDTAAIQSKLSVYSYRLNSDFPYHIYYLNHCGFNHETHALHMVFQGKKGRVTAFISKIPVEQKTQFTQSGMRGEISPLPQGSLVIVGEMDEDISELSNKISPMLELRG